jgi:hypothetical protein
MLVLEVLRITLAPEFIILNSILPTKQVCGFRLHVFVKSNKSSL